MTMIYIIKNIFFTEADKWISTYLDQVMVTEDSWLKKIYPD